MKKVSLSVCILLLSAAVVSAQINKRNTVSSAKLETNKARGFQPPACVAAASRVSGAHRGTLVLEKDSLLTVDFWDSWGKCIINNKGQVLSSTGTFRQGDSLPKIGIMEERYPLTDPSGQLTLPNAWIYVAFSINNRAYSFATFQWPEKGANSLTVYPVAYNKTKYCVLKLSQNKWTISYSQLPEFVQGSDVTAVYYYTSKKRNFYYQDF